MASGPASSGGMGLTGAYGSASGQLNPGYSSTSGSTGFEAVSRPQDESMESNSAMHHRCFIHVMYICYFYFLNFYLLI
jgi:hypothetical protein